VTSRFVGNAPNGDAINRVPINRGATEAIYEVRMTAAGDHRDEARELLRARLEAANYPIQDMEITEREHDDIELVATLLRTAADPRDSMRSSPASVKTQR
jgi:putative Mg2+ transporter-C (MgtC) family protein